MWAHILVIPFAYQKGLLGSVGDTYTYCSIKRDEHTLDIVSWQGPHSVGLGFINILQPCLPRFPRRSETGYPTKRKEKGNTYLKSSAASEWEGGNFMSSHPKSKKNFFSSTHARKRETQKSFFCLLLFFLQVRFRLSIQKRREIRRIYLSFLSKIYGRPLFGRHWLFIAPIFRGAQYFFIFLRNRLANLFLAREAVVLLDRERETGGGRKGYGKSPTAQP